jgi:hypothetical protein
MTERPCLSVVMAVPRGAFESEAARLAFHAQLDTLLGDELIVEKGETESLLVPKLWTRGIVRSRGDVVALTLGSMVPDPNWTEVVRRSFQEPIAGVGGSIEPAQEMRPLDWAIHLTRYSGYLLPFEAGDVDDLPGDNAAYRREAIEACRPLWTDGFWETTVDACLRLRGERLRLTPEMLVRQGRSVGPLAFCRNRFRHGKHHAREKGRGLTLPNRMFRALSSPAVPAVLLLRIARRAASRGRVRGFLLGLPYLVLFLSLWAAGEAAGYCRGHD